MKLVLIASLVHGSQRTTGSTVPDRRESLVEPGVGVHVARRADEEDIRRASSAPHRAAVDLEAGGWPGPCVHWHLADAVLSRAAASPAACRLAHDDHPHPVVVEPLHIDGVVGRPAIPVPRWASAERRAQSKVIPPRRQTHAGRPWRRCQPHGCRGCSWRRAPRVSKTARPPVLRRPAICAFQRRQPPGLSMACCKIEKPFR